MVGKPGYGPASRTSSRHPLPEAPAGGPSPRSRLREPFRARRRLLLRAVLLAGLAPGAWRAAPAAEGAVGAIRGVVYDKDFQVPLAQVRVSIIEALRATITSADGNFLIEQVPPGTYTVSFSKDGYEREVVPGVVVAAGQLAELRVELSSEVIDMEELVVTGIDLLANSEAGVLEVRAAAVSVQDAISSDLIRKAGVSDVAGALKLVVGASVLGGKYATVRGLSDRYTGTTLNGVRIPSADPRRRAVQVDLFPTGTIDGVTVTKTFTPDLQGDFTGGGVDIRTRSIPERFLLSLSASAGYNTRATRNVDFLTYAGGGVDRLGRLADDRTLPSAARQSLPPFPVFSAHPPPSQVQASQAYDRLVRSFTPTLGVSASAPGPDEGLSIMAGDRFGADGGAVIGLVGGLTYTHKYDFYEGGRNNNAAVSGPDQSIAVTKPRTDSKGTDELLIGALGAFVLQPSPDHELSLQWIGNKSVEDEARFQVQDTGFPSVEQNQSLHYTERKVGSAQLHGRHRFPGLHDLELAWVGATNLTRQDEPDVRFFRNAFNFSTLSGEKPANSTDAQNTRRIFRDIEERNLQAGFDLSLPFTQWTRSRGKIKSGLFLDRTDRDYEQRSFTYTFPNQLGSIFNSDVAYNRSLARFVAASPQQLWTDVFLDPDRIGLASNTPPAPNQLLWVITPVGDDVNYSGAQRIDAFYGMAELPLTQMLRLIGGSRLERTDLSVEPANEAFGTVQVIHRLPSGDREIVSVPQEQAAAQVDETSILPSLGLVYEVAPGMNLRVSWSRTIARPTLRELAPVATEEFIFGDEFLGNPALSLSRITNYDIRWEWFRKPGEVLALSGFYKQLEDPIEQISFSAGGRSFIQPVNYRSGVVLGGELEARTSLGFVAGRLRGLMLGANVTYLASRVDVPRDEQESLAPFGLDEPTRRLQGQPEYVLNVNLTYDNDRSGTSAGAFYNLVGDTLITGAARGVEDGNPSVFEEPLGSLDVTFSQKIGKGHVVSLRGENLLRPPRRSVYRTPGGGEVVKSERDSARRFVVTGTIKW